MSWSHFLDCQETERDERWYSAPFLPNSIQDSAMSQHCPHCYSFSNLTKTTTPGCPAASSLGDPRSCQVDDDCKLPHVPTLPRTWLSLYLCSTTYELLATRWCQVSYPHQPFQEIGTSTCQRTSIPGASELV